MKKEVEQQTSKGDSKDQTQSKPQPNAKRKRDSEVELGSIPNQVSQRKADYVPVSSVKLPSSLILRL